MKKLVSAEIELSIAQQVSHDIRSPLAVLNAFLKILPDIEEDKQKLLLSAIERINGIADDLSSKKRRSSAPNHSTISELLPRNDEAPDVIWLSDLLKSLISEKRFDIKDRRMWKSN